MKICMLTSIFPRFKGDHCGAGTTIYEMAKKLSSQHGLDMSVVAPNYYRIPKYEVMEGVKVYRFSYFFPRKLQKLAYDAGIPTNLRKFKLAKIQLPLVCPEFLFSSVLAGKKCRHPSHPVDFERTCRDSPGETISETNAHQRASRGFLGKMDAAIDQIHCRKCRLSYFQ